MKTWSLPLDSVTKKTLTVSQAASTYHVPRKTLNDRVKGQVVHGTKPGRDTVLSDKEEEALCSYLIYMAERGFPFTHRTVMVIARAVALRSGKGSRKHFQCQISRLDSQKQEYTRLTQMPQIQKVLSTSCVAVPMEKQKPGTQQSRRNLDVLNKIWDNTFKYVVGIPEDIESYIQERERGGMGS